LVNLAEKKKAEGRRKVNLTGYPGRVRKSSKISLFMGGERVPRHVKGDRSGDLIVCIPIQEGGGEGVGEKV